MHETPPSEAIRQAVIIHLNLLSRQTRRDYAGFAVGQRRKLAIVPFIAREMTARLLEQVTLADVEADATAEAVAKRIEAMLNLLSAGRGVSDCQPRRRGGRSRASGPRAADYA